MSSLLVVGAFGLYLFLGITRPRIGAALVFALFAWFAYEEGARGDLSGVAFSICCGLLCGGLPVVCDRLLPRTQGDRA